MQKLKKLLAWLAGVFETEVVWIEKEGGVWAKRRRYHPAAKAGALICVLLLCVLAGWFFLSSGTGVEPEVSVETAPPVAEVLSSDAEVPELGADASPDLALEPGPVPDDLQVAEGEYWIRVDKGGYKLHLYRGGDVEKTYEIAVGRNPGDKERVGDNKTPNGIFTVQSIEDSSSWSHDFGDGNGNIRGAYGPWFIRLRTGWSGIGIHGTHDPESLGSMVSEGCVRMHNSELEELKKFASVKMKVVIEE